MDQFQMQLLEKINSILEILNNDISWIPNMICTLAGVFLGSFLTYIFSIIGKFKIYVVEFKYEYSKNEMGSIIKTEMINDAMYCEINIVIDILNTKNQPIGLRNTIIEFVSNNKVVLEYYAKEYENITIKNYSMKNDEIEVLNIEAKKLLEKK